MKKMLLIASYGGSGSTYLANRLHDLVSDEFDIFHTHTIPQDGKVGIPVFNRLTGHNEGPVSRYIGLPAGSRIVIIYRSPAEAYLSRCSYKHFLHIWSDTPRIRELFPEPPTREQFLEKWSEFRASQNDILGMSEYLHIWKEYARSSEYDLTFVKYEDLRQNGPALLEFLGLEEATEDPFSGFDPVSRDIPENVSVIFEGLQATLDDWPAMETFPASTPPALEPPERACRKMERRNTYFTITGIGAGASDVVARMSMCYDVVTSVLNAGFILPDYRNYHSPELDFFALYGIKDAFSQNDDVATDNLNTVELTFSDFVFQALFDKDFFQDNTFYKIKADIYENDFRLFYIRKAFQIERKFMDALSYTPSGSIFSDQDGVVKVTIHLRRNDICGHLFEAAGLDAPQGMESRELLTLQRAIKALESTVPAGSRVEAFVSSDGFEKLKKRHAEQYEVLEACRELEDDLLADPASDSLKVTIIDRVIGTDTAATITTLDAMYQSDIVVTASSSFPNVVSFLGKTRILNGLTA
jgi:hypothetical protein